MCVFVVLVVDEVVRVVLVLVVDDVVIEVLVVGSACLACG